MGSLYRSAHELVFVFKFGKDKHTNNVQLGQYGRYRTNVWNYPGMNSIARKTEEGNLLELHPTVKPVALVADAIMDVSSRGDVVLDSFLGSGSTLIAAEKTGRAGDGVELEPAYVDVAGEALASLDRPRGQTLCLGSHVQRSSKGGSQCQNSKTRELESDENHSPEFALPVGYGKPPRNTRFKRGVSGNPNGRPKGSPQRRFSIR